MFEVAVVIVEGKDRNYKIEQDLLRKGDRKDKWVVWW